MNFATVTNSSSALGAGGNPGPGVNTVINTVQPGLVSRATGCMMCHAQVASNVITDFGYGGDGNGFNYFFGGVPGQTLPSGLTNDEGGSIYGDYDFNTGGNQNWGSAQIASGVEVVVPQASTAGLSVTDPTLASYLQDMLGQNPTATGVTVKEVSSLYIGAPTVARIKTVSGVAAGGLTYIPASGSAPAFSGIALDSSKGFYTNTGTISCEGDVAIDGILYLNKPVIQTVMGCRLYVTQTVFVDGPVTYANTNNTQNLQISSAKFIGLGIGHNICNNTTDSYPDSINERLNYNSDSRFAGFFTRTLGTPQQMIASVAADANTVDANGNILYDAVCGPGARSVGFNHLFLNAPVVESRYQGEYDGLIVGEITLMSLESLNYVFDPVFLSVPILPLLDNSDYLTMQN